MGCELDYYEADWARDDWEDNHPGPNLSDLREGICTCCGEHCREVLIDESFAHAFGVQESYRVASHCCEAEVVSEDEWAEMNEDEDDEIEDDE